MPQGLRSSGFPGCVRLTPPGGPAISNDVIKTFAGRILLPGETIEEDEQEIQKEEGISAPNQTPPTVGDNSGRLVGTFLEDVTGVALDVANVTMV